MGETIVARMASCIDAVTTYWIDPEEIDGKINLIYQLLSISKSTVHYESLADIR